MLEKLSLNAAHTYLREEITYSSSKYKYMYHKPLACHQSMLGKVQCLWFDLTGLQYLLHYLTRSQQLRHGQLWQPKLKEYNLYKEK